LAELDKAALLLEEDLRINCGRILCSFAVPSPRSRFHEVTNADDGTSAPGANGARALDHARRIAGHRKGRSTTVVSVLLHEPVKERVLAWKTGDPIIREADVILMRKAVVTEVRMDLVKRKVESWKERKGVQAPIFISDLFAMGDLAKSDPRMQAGFTKRGIKDMTTVECLALPFGYFALVPTENPIQRFSPM
jgi:hypothetical protein